MCFGLACAWRRKKDGSAKCSGYTWSKNATTEQKKKKTVRWSYLLYWFQTIITGQTLCEENRGDVLKGTTCMKTSFIKSVSLLHVFLVAVTF